MNKTNLYKVERYERHKTGTVTKDRIAWIVDYREINKYSGNDV